MTAPPRPDAIGIDVVDPGERRVAGKSADRRFIDRVFAPEESARIVEAKDSDLALWIHWAAKEAAFKVESCVRGTPPVFAHSTFVFRPNGPLPGGPRAIRADGAPSSPPAWRPALAGVVDREGRQHPVLISLDGAITAIAGPHGMSVDALRRIGVGVGIDTVESVRARLGTPAELESIRADARWSPEADRAHSPASALVRLALREDLRRELRRFGDPRADEAVVVTPAGPRGRTPPWAGTPDSPFPDVQISISHHGHLLAWAWRISAAEDASS